ncbi:FMN-binding negative transcriptional regulator [Fluviispira vulneris]|uniref:FMN-binding negative transcriptional regulator n=1 Tax=Fluviispira vulneris TaxID=2763012 RepID=UPI0016471D0E|nr:FMN-binding negative transcriptional regulator [Fluviispira vulneris]
MFIPIELEHNKEWLEKKIIQHNPLATLILRNEELEVTSLPVSLSGNKLLGHLARRNNITKILTTGTHAHLVFNSHNSYISPTWYRNKDYNVPTWNYCTILAKVRINKITDKEEIKTLLEKQVAYFEKTNWSMSSLSEALMNEMLSEIIGFEFEILSLKSKFKISQNRTDEDRISIMQNLNEKKNENYLIHNIMQDFYELV